MIARFTTRIFSCVKHCFSIATVNVAILVGFFTLFGCVGSAHHTAIFSDIALISSVSDSSLHNAKLNISFVFSPRSCPLGIDAQEPLKIEPFKTPWGNPWNHKELVINMNTILEKNGVKSPNARVRMISHAVVASGWRQNVWNYNAWGVQQGSWRGSYYVMNTIEEDDEGISYQVQGAPWRAFTSWSEAVADFHNRIHPNSKRPSYRQAHRHLHNLNSKWDAVYWTALGEGNYYTAKNFTPKKFAILCLGVRQILEEKNRFLNQ